MWGADELWWIGAIANVCDMIWYDITVTATVSQIYNIVHFLHFDFSLSAILNSW